MTPKITREELEKLVAELTTTSAENLFKDFEDKVLNLSEEFHDFASACRIAMCLTEAHTLAAVKEILIRAFYEE